MKKNFNVGAKIYLLPHDMLQFQMVCHHQDNKITIELTFKNKNTYDTDLGSSDRQVDTGVDSASPLGTGGLCAPVTLPNITFDLINT